MADQSKALDHLKKSEYRYRAILVFVTLLVAIFIAIRLPIIAKQSIDKVNQSIIKNQQIIICMLLVPQEQRTTDTAQKCRNQVNNPPPKVQSQPQVQPPTTTQTQANTSPAPENKINTVTPNNNPAPQNATPQEQAGNPKPQDCKIDILGIKLICN